ncbi:oligosaccharide flippase family protein [Caldiplasma sukawensis]
MELSEPKEYLGISAIFQYLGNGVQILSGSLFYIVAARIFTPSDLGVLALFLAIVGIFGILFSLGLNTGVTHFVSYYLESQRYSPFKALKRILFLGLLTGFIGLIILLLLSPYISITFFHSANFSLYIKYLSIVIFETIIFNILVGAINGFQKFKISAIVSIFIWTLYYFGAIILALFLHSLIAIIYGWIIGLSLGIILGIIIIFILIRLSNKNIKGDTLDHKTIILYSLPVLFSSIIGYGASYTDRFVVAYFLNSASLGIYNFTLLFYSGILFIVGPFNNIILPKFSNLFGNNLNDAIRENTRISSLLLSFFYTPASFGVAALSPLLLYYIAGPSYVQAKIPLMIVMIITSFFISQNILIQAISSIRKTKLFIYSSSLSLIVNILLSFLLIPSYGITGASIGFSSVSIVSFIVIYNFAKDYNIVKFDILGMIKVWISAFLMFIVLFILTDKLISFYGYSPFFIIFLIILGAFIFILIANLLKIFNEDEKNFIYSIFPENYNFLKKLIKLII